MANLIKLPKDSHVTHAGYDAAARRLTVGFRDGQTGSYGGVSPEQWEAFQKAESYGKWLHSEVKSNPDRHPWTKGSG